MLTYSLTGMYIVARSLVAGVKRLMGQGCKYGERWEVQYG
jgi:hypothetical protein